MLAGAAVGTVEYRSITQPVRSLNKHASYVEATADVQRGQDEEEDDDDLFGYPAKDFDAYESDEEPVAAPRVHARDEPAEGLNEENGGRPRRRARTGG